MPIPIIIGMVTIAQTLSPNYTKQRPIGHVTSNALNTLHPAELAWIVREWSRFTGGPEDHDYNVICELTTPISNTRVWICDRDGEDAQPMLMLPEDY